MMMDQSAGRYGLTQWVDFLKAKSLPVHVRTVQQLQYLIQDPRTSLQKLVAPIERDPVFALHLVKLGNTLSRNPTTHIGTVKLGVSILGMDRIAALCEQLPTIKINHASVAHKQYFHAIANSFHASIQAADLCRFPGKDMINETRMAALFFGIGHWALWRYAPVQMSAVMIKIHEEQADVVLAENDVFGCTIQQISLELARHWKLSHLALDALDHNKSPDRAFLDKIHRYAQRTEEFSDEETRAIKQLLSASFYPVKLANWLALAQPLGWQSAKSQRILELISDFLRRPVDHVIRRINANTVKASRLYHLNGIMAPATQMLLLPSAMVLNYRLENPDDVAPSSIPGIAEPKKLATSRAHEHRPPAIADPIGDLPTALADPALFKEIAERLMHQPQHYEKLNDIFNDLLRAISQGIGLDRVMLYSLDEHNSLQGAARIGMLATDPIARFSLSLEIPSIFKRLGHKPQALWVSTHNRRNIWQELPARFRSVCHPQSFMLMSLFRDKQLVGFVYADRERQALAISPFQFKSFKNICGATNLCLSQHSAHTE